MKVVKITIKIFLTVIIGIMLINCIDIGSCYAVEDETKSSGLDLTSIFNKGNKFINTGENGNKMPEEDIEEKFIPVGQTLIIAANAIIIIVVAVMGVKWITAKPEQQAKLKEQLIGLVVSIVVIYSAVGIWTVITNFMKEIF